MTNQVERYNGFILTAESFGSHDPNKGAWSIDLLMRPLAAPAEENQRIGQTRVLANSEQEALRKGIVFGKQLIDRKLVAKPKAAPLDASLEVGG
jgi:5-formyltetrahydrofolate cyclo-ligase